MYAHIRIVLEIALLTWNFAHFWVRRLRVKRTVAVSCTIAVSIQLKFLNLGVERSEFLGIFILKNADCCDRI